MAQSGILTFSAGETSKTISVAAHPGYAATNLQTAGPRMAGSKWMEGLMEWGNKMFAQSARMGALPVLYDDGAGNILYGVPRRLKVLSPAPGRRFGAPSCARYGERMIGPLSWHATQLCPWVPAGEFQAPSDWRGAVTALGSAFGWYITLGTGEKVDGPSTTLSGTTFFGTNTPDDSGASCVANLGVARVYAVNYLTGGGYVLPCPNEANVNGAGMIDLSDLSALVNYLTGGGYQLPTCP